MGSSRMIPLSDPDAWRDVLREKRLSMLDIHYLVATPQSVDHFTERHEMGLFSHEEYVAAFQDAGLEVSHDPQGLFGRGLYVGSAAGRRDLPRGARGAVRFKRAES